MRDRIITLCRLQDNPIQPDGLSIGTILLSTEPGNWHSGFIFRSGDKSLRFAHLAFHLSLCNDPVGSDLGNSLYFEFSVDEEQQLFLAATLEQIVEDNQGKIPYSVEHDGINYFSEEGIWKGTAPGLGLTCATFVTAFLARYGYQILDYSTWGDRSGDLERKAELLVLLRKKIERNGGDVTHVDVQESRLGSTHRVRASDANAAVALFVNAPLPFEKISYLSGILESAP